MNNLVFMLIGFISIGITVQGQIKAYANDEYNPYVFRMRTKQEFKFIYMLAYFGFMMPIFMIQDALYSNIYVATLLISTFLPLTILNYMSYRSSRDSRILIESSILGLAYIGLIYLILANNKF